MPRSQSQSAECYLAKYRFACSTPLNFARTASAQIKSNALEEGQRLPQSFESVRFPPKADISAPLTPGRPLTSLSRRCIAEALPPKPTPIIAEHLAALDAPL